MQNLENSRYQAAESAISAANASTLAPMSGFATGGAFLTGGGDVSATPAVDGQRVYSRPPTGSSSRSIGRRARRSGRRISRV